MKKKSYRILEDLVQEELSRLATVEGKADTYQELLDISGELDLELREPAGHKKDEQWVSFTKDELETLEGLAECEVENCREDIGEAVRDGDSSTLRSYADTIDVHQKIKEALK